MTDSEARHDGVDPAITADNGRGAGARKAWSAERSYHLRDFISDRNRERPAHDFAKHRGKMARILKTDT